MNAFDLCRLRDMQLRKSHTPFPYLLQLVKYANIVNWHLTRIVRLQIKSLPVISAAFGIAWLDKVCGAKWLTLNPYADNIIYYVIG